jgi:formate-dependent nitrite reductase cytochrome c552 subunit
MQPNLSRRALRDEHATIALQHAAGQLWCLDCHQAQDRDNLRLTTGASLPFNESYRLCGQCHGEKLRDWQIGLHGKRTGYWDGDKQFLLCSHCHNPHEPKFKAVEPQPPPERPGRATHRS